MGSDFDVLAFDSCNSTKFIYEMFDNDTSKYLSFTGNKLNDTSLSIPCGLVAKSFFNDTFTVFNKNDTEISFNQTGIAPKFEYESVFANNNKTKDNQWLDLKNEHFIVWQEMDTLPHIKKLYSINKDSIEPGLYKVMINNSK